VDKSKLNHGHRQRLREKILLGNKLADYELLELFLCNTIVRQDTKAISKTLIQKCGGLSKIFSTDYSNLKKIDGVGDSVIASLFAMREIINEILKEEITSVKDSQEKQLVDRKEIKNYLRTKIGHSKTEILCVLYFDQNTKLIHEEINDNGTIDTIAVYSREIIKKALEISATQIIISHNHPSGNPTPSQSDISYTLDLQKVCKSLGIHLVDHIIVTSEKNYCSFYMDGII
jgi:DNA repair protein RadC